jgi:hypothetical protein
VTDSRTNHPTVGFEMVASPDRTNSPIRIATAARMTSARVPRTISSWIRTAA